MELHQEEDLCSLDSIDAVQILLRGLQNNGNIMERDNTGQDKNAQILLRVVLRFFSSATSCS